MANRKYTRMNEDPSSYECCNKKCKWTGTDNEKSLQQVDFSHQEYICPVCGNNEFYGLLPIKSNNYELENCTT